MATATRDIIIEELNDSIWVAAMGEDGRLADIELDPIMEEVRWGSIYWAKVARIDKSMDAAFIALDGENIGLLHNADVRIVKKNGTIVKGGERDIGHYIQPGQMIAVQAKTAYMPLSGDPARPSDDKKPRLTMNIALPGRYLIHTPVEKENRVSNRIRNKSLRKQLVTMLDNLPAEPGFILRAAASDTQTEFLAREATILNAIWSQLQEHFTGDQPNLIMLGPDAVQRTLSDQAHHAISKIFVSTLDHFKIAEEWCDVFAPELVTRIEPIKMKNADTEFALFDHYDIIPQIEGLFQPYAMLPSGASIIIQETAALTAIDVNRGADERSNLTINLDCAWEIGRQLVLRNMGGAILIDFLKMGGKADQDKLLDHIEAWFLKNDPCTVQIHGFTGLGLLEISRQRRTPPLLERYQCIISDN
jgi:ribonuclease G